MNARTDIDRAARWGWPILEEAAEHASFKSERAIARKMLAERNRRDMTRLLANLSESIPPPFHRQMFLLDGILVPMGLADREKVDESKHAASKVEKLERDINAKLREAAKLLHERDELAAPDGVQATCSGSPLDWLRDGLAHADAHTQGLAGAGPLPAMEHLDERYDLKYWPALPDVLNGLADRFAETYPELVHPDLEKAAQGYRGPRQLLRLLWHGQFRQAGRTLPLESNTDTRTAPLDSFRLDDTDTATLLRMTAGGIEYDPGTIKKARHNLCDAVKAENPDWARFLVDE
ncbi:hypothetical protein [Thioalkalivibrio sp. ALR17-21]|uniref:hypothetical protein n=1 Tax=Thioalkalivibrio sp. ALR17-21 TaxID=1269813 RepID=UPI000462BF1B|nr:hypothetical protein [Thioalkalivibrio sp. ALR17-21]